MRIVDVCGFYTPAGGGVKTYIDHKLRAVSGFGHELIVIAPGAEDSFVEIAPGGWLMTLANPAFPLDSRYHYFTNEPQLHAALDRFAPDIVECGTQWMSADMVARWQGPARRSLIMHCDTLATYPYRWLRTVMDRRNIDRSFEWFWRRLRRLGAAYDVAICPNNDLAHRLSSGGVPNIVCEPMGVEPGRFSPSLRDEGLRAKLLEACRLGPEATLLIGVGRHSPEKRWPMISKAATAAGYHGDLGLVIVGEGRDRPRIERAIAGNPHIRLHPAADRKTLAALMASADALVHGSESESFGLVGAEARASGLPVIVPDRGGTVDQARNGMGWIYPAGEGAALAGVLRQIMGGDLAACRTRTAAAAPFVRTMDEHFADLFARYSTLTAQLKAA